MKNTIMLVLALLQGATLIYLAGAFCNMDWGYLSTIKPIDRGAMLCCTAVATLMFYLGQASHTTDKEG